MDATLFLAFFKDGRMSGSGKRFLKINFSLSSYSAVGYYEIPKGVLSAMKDPQEKRKFKRFLLPVAHYEEMDGKHISGISDVWNVSRSGFRILSPVAIKKGTVLHFRINVPNVLNIVCEGKVRWGGVASGKMYWLGLCFTKIDPADKMDLLNYGYDYWLETEKTNHT